MVKNLILIALILGLLAGFLLSAGPALLHAITDTTEYSPGYSESAFNAIREGMTQDEVRQRLGQPGGTHEGYPGLVRWYGPAGSRVDENSGLHVPAGSDHSKSGIVQFDLGGTTALWAPYAGQTADEISAVLGQPIKEKIERSVVNWRYSWSDGNYHRRWIGFDPQGRVAEKVAYFWWD